MLENTDRGGCWKSAGRSCTIDGFIYEIEEYKVLSPRFFPPSFDAENEDNDYSEDDRLTLF